MSTTIAAGIYEQDFSVPGAAVGDVATASFSQELAGCTLTAHVPLSNTVRVQLLNNTAGTVNLASGQLKLTVYKG